MEEGKDIVKHGFNTAGNQVYHCKRCGRFFTETINTPLYHRHLPKADVVLICKLAVEKLGVRAIERVTGKHRDTVSRVLRDVADFAGSLNDEVLRNIATGTFEVDELWTMVEKKRSTSPRT
jgi:transposase-like protein